MRPFCIYGSFSTKGRNMLKGPNMFLLRMNKSFFSNASLIYSLCGYQVNSRVSHRRPNFFVSNRQLGSSNGSVDKGNEKKAVYLKYPERTVSVYTCENIYEKWKRDQTFYFIPKSGVYADISYIDSVGQSEGGKAPMTVLCIHGIPGNYSVFSHLINELGSRGIRVVVPSFPAALYLPGKHGTQLFRHSVEEKTQVFKDFLKALGISKVDAIIAHSSAIYPALRLALDPEVSVKCQAFFNTGGHKKTVTMKPYWIIWSCTYLYLNPLGRKLVQKTGKFIMKYIMKTPIKDDNFDGIMLLAITMVFSQYWEAKEQFKEVARRKLPTLYCFSEDDKVVERRLTYEVVSLLGATKENISYLDSEVNVVKKGKEMSWLSLISFEKGSHYVFRKHPEICNRKVLELLNKIKDKSKT